MIFSLPLFYKYTNGDEDKLRKAVGGQIQHNNRAWAKIIRFDGKYVRLGEHGLVGGTLVVL